MVAELELQVESWKKEAGLLSDAVTQSEKERAAWLGRMAEMQKRLEEGATDLEGAKGKLKESESRFAEEEERRRVVEREREELKAALTGALKEKTVLDGAVECIRNDFERVRKSFELMKSILAQREKEILEMRAANSKREAELALAEQRGRGENDSKVFADDMPKDSRTEVIGPPEPSEIQRSGNVNSDQAERKIEDASKSSIFGTPPCCIAAMERVDLEWRQKHKTSVRALIKKLSQKQKRLMESENLCGDILDPVKGTQIQLPQTIPPFSVLPVPTKLNESMIMQLISKGQEVIKRSNNYCMAPLKPSLVSLEDEVRNLENKIKCTFPAEQLRNFPAFDAARAMK
ncbi:uncharacterized protein LOC124158531 [Ischnura elegans]|uniref:uncharacterized protein LOC124158531 n=1 Tax=Ischnura elegans TaxID=197161 RepID=UPI001ED86D78|nr:uncharacterized protein LOC124158531 [Ischnura elegans]